MAWLRNLPWALWGALIVLVGIGVRALRRDAARDALKDQKIQDKERAHEIADDVRDATHDLERVRDEYKDHGYRD